MCLYVNSEKKPELREAVGDITVWKVLVRNSRGISTPYQRYPVTDKTMVADGCCRPENDGLAVKLRWRISEGVIHSYAHGYDAELVARRLKLLFGFCSIVVEATIPAGTPCILGEEDACIPSYGSTQLVLKNIEI